MVDSKRKEYFLKIALKDKDAHNRKYSRHGNSKGSIALDMLKRDISIYNSESCHNLIGHGFVSPLPLIKDDDWVVAKFVPYSQENAIEGYPSSYKTGEAALEGAIEYLDENGYVANDLHLKDYINQHDPKTV